METQVSSLIRLWDEFVSITGRLPKPWELGHLGRELNRFKIDKIKIGTIRPIHFEAAHRPQVDELIRKMIAPKNTKAIKKPACLETKQAPENGNNITSYTLIKVIDRMSRRIEDLEAEVLRLRAIKISPLTERARKALAVYGD